MEGVLEVRPGAGGRAVTQGSPRKAATSNHVSLHSPACSVTDT